MRKGRKPYENKAFLDPGQMRNKLDIYRWESEDDGYGGSTQKLIYVGTTWVAITPIRNTSDYNLKRWGIIAGVTEFSSLVYLSYRNIPNLDIGKEHVIILNDQSRYVVAGLSDTDDPLTIVRIVAYKDYSSRVLLGGELEINGFIYPLENNVSQKISGEI